ncbi:hypothetical protein BO82DRAFT_71127 [Aspergillus uvarum CBS 121591]|uniref:Uncharacterized protein n=1 Tax=Aspergillus uvarum CBS 121591 TaxID=1448315 RepID=A0A319C941_9EURO|nr:hypothetical protein BO82DRAFT_71127 [Aspergillus uvarum CBS 121591]PYH81955.1 hypothetical protein BO82DRAFT_71127 [Aspergillus uvarum CBS 121591]
MRQGPPPKLRIRIRQYPTRSWMVSYAFGFHLFHCISTASLVNDGFSPLHLGKSLTIFTALLTRLPGDRARYVSFFRVLFVL